MLESKCSRHTQRAGVVDIAAILGNDVSGNCPLANRAHDCFAEAQFADPRVSKYADIHKTSAPIAAGGRNKLAIEKTPERDLVVYFDIALIDFFGGTVISQYAHVLGNT